MTDSSLKAVFFDWDGTFADTEPVSLAITRRVLSDYANGVFGRTAFGRTIDDKLDRLDMRGKDFGQIGRQFQELVNEELPEGEKITIDIEDLRTNKLRPATKEALLGASLAPGIGETVTALQDELNLGVAIVSNSPRLRIQPLLDKHAFNARIPAGRLFSAFEDVAGRLKEDPAIYLLAAEKLNILPGESAAVEDSVTGMRAAKRAGIGFRVGYTGLVAPAEAEHMRQKLLEEGAHVVISDMKQLPAAIRNYRPGL